MENPSIYCVQYTVVNLFDGDKCAKYVKYSDKFNALRYAEALSCCCIDVDGNVDVVNDFTGEVIATYKQGKEIYFADSEF